MDFLSEEELKKQCPAIYATTPSTHVSDKYTFIPTNQVISDLEKLNWFPVKAKQLRVRNPEYEFSNFHSLRFRTKNNLDLTIMRGEIIPEMILSTSHLGRHSYKMNMGFFRVLCSNGLVAQEISVNSLKIKHMGITFEQVEELVSTFTKQLPESLDEIKLYKEIILNSDKKEELVKKALEIKYKNHGNFPYDNYNDYLIPRREDDRKDDLWTVFNVVQENIIKGGISILEQGRKRTTKAISSPFREFQVNKELWTLLALFVSK